MSCMVIWWVATLATCLIAFTMSFKCLMQLKNWIASLVTKHFFFHSEFPQSLGLRNASNNILKRKPLLMIIPLNTRKLKKALRCLGEHSMSHWSYHRLFSNVALGEEIEKTFKMILSLFRALFNSWLFLRALDNCWIFL
jgi:hypothetical protein